MKSIIIAIIELEIDMTTFYTYPESTRTMVKVKFDLETGKFLWMGNNKCK
jgi:hypothetical protein